MLSFFANFEVASLRYIYIYHKPIGRNLPQGPYMGSYVKSQTFFSSNQELWKHLGASTTIECGSPFRHGIWCTLLEEYIVFSLVRNNLSYGRMGKYICFLSKYYRIYEKEKRYYLLSRIVSNTNIFIFFTKNILGLFHLSSGLWPRVRTCIENSWHSHTTSQYSPPNNEE